MITILRLLNITGIDKYNYLLYEYVNMESNEFSPQPIVRENYPFVTRSLIRLFN